MYAYMGNKTLTISYFLGSTNAANASPSFFSCKFIMLTLEKLKLRRRWVELGNL